MIAGRLELLLLLFIVVHGKVVTTNSGVATNPPVLHAVARCALGTASMKGAEKKSLWQFSATPRCSATPLKVGHTNSTKVGHMNTLLLLYTK